MKRTGLRIIVAAVLAALIVGAGYFAVTQYLLAPATPVLPANIKPGYVGVTVFASWRLICSAVTAASAPSATPASNECRINHEVADRTRPGQVIAAVNLGVTSTSKQRLAMIRLPPTAQTGDVVLLRADDATRARLAVTVCSANECAAGGPIAEEDWEKLIEARALQLAFPARNRQRVLVDVPVNGLRGAAHALSVAQN